MRPPLWRKTVLLALMRPFASKLIRMAAGERRPGSVSGAWLGRTHREDLWAMQWVLFHQSPLSICI